MASDVLRGLLDRVGLWTNMRKTVSMDWQPCFVLGSILVIIREADNGYRANLLLETAE